MIRRSRISVRPNVKPTGRALTTSRDASQDNTQALADSAPSKGSEVTEDVAKTDPPIAAPEQTNQEAAQSSSCANHTEATSHAEDAASKSSESQATTSTAVTSGTQRRKRFTALPNLAKPRVTATSSRTPKSPPKSPVKPVTSIEPQKITPTGESTHQTSLDNESVRIPRTSGRRRPSGGGRPPKAQPIPEPLSQSNEETQDAGTSEDTVVQLTDQQDESRCPLKTSQPDPLLVQESPTESLPLPEKDTFIQHENNSGPPPEQSQPDPSGKLELQSSSKVLTSLKALNDPADMLRLAKARKLRELLRKEMNKDKEEKKKPKMGFKERKAPKDHTKMTMRELIYYLPATNPMKSFSEEDQRSSEIVLPNSPKPTSSKASAGPSAQEERTRDVGHQEEEDERIDENQPEEEEPLLVPRVKVAEDGSLIIDEESLTVQVARAKGPNPAEDRDPIFERGSTTTYSSFRKGTYTKPWSNGETEMFYLAISMVGTDFSMIGQLFPHRARVEIKNKFKKEERANSWRIDKAFKEKRRLDLEFFKKLMEQILKDEEKKKKKNKDLAKAQRKPRAAKRKEIETSEGSDSDVVAGEKENEELSTDGGSDVTPKKRKGKGGETSQKRIKKRNAKALSEDPEDSQNVASEGLSSDDGRLKESHSSENMSKSPGIKPAQLTGRPQRPLPTLSRRWGNRRPELKKNLEKGASDGEEGRQDRSPKMSPVLNQEREKKQATLLHELEDVDEESDLTSVQEHIFNKPTRSGRIPKLSQHVMQAAAEEEEDEDELSDLPVSSKVRGQGLQASSRRAKLKPGPSLKRDMPRTGKSRLVTLRASRTEDDEDEEEDVVTQSQDDFSSNPEEENQVFVPMSLRPQLPVNSEVVETMEELDISLNVPDILGTSQNALCPELSCEQAVMPAGSVSCENQLDLLVDVIEFLEPEPMEVCKETSNEAAQTLLTIGNSAQIIQAAGLPSTDENDHVEESSSLVQQEVIQQEVINTDLVDHLIVDASTMISGPSVSCETENKSHLLTCESHCPEPPSEEATTSIEEPIKIKTIDTVPDTTPHETQNMAASVQSTPPSRRGRFSKPKPNVGQSLRTRRGQQQEVSPELVTDSVGNSGAPCETEQVKNPTEPMEEPHALDYLPQDSSTVPTDVMQPATLPERGEDITDVFPDRLIEADQESALLKGKNNDIVTEERKDEQKEKKELDAKLEQQQTNSVSVSQSKSQEPSKSVRRCRGPKPKPNLTQKSRPTHTQTQQSTSTTKALNERPNSAESAEVSTVTYSKSPEESAVVTAQSNISQSTIQQETETLDGEPFEAIKIITTQVVSEDKSRQKTVVMSEENTRNTPEEVLENTPVELPGCVLENTPADPVPDEPVFIISLTEIPPTIDERTGFEPKPLPPTAELHSNGQSANETEKTSRKVSHLLITDTLGPVSEEQEKEREIQTEEETRRRELKRKTPSSTSQGSKAESQAEHHVEELERPVVEETENEKEHLEKKRKLPERTRRAKLQVKPNPVSRRNTRGTLAKEKTPEPSFEQTTSRPISTQETISVSETILPASISENSDLSTSTIISDTETTRENPPIPVPTQPTSNLIGSPQFASQDNAPQESGQEGCSQGTVNQVDVPGKEAVELAATEASGSRADSEDVHQITPVATPGPLTRPGRKPKGFLSFISSKNTQGSPGAHLRAKPGPQKPAVNTARPERKRLTPSIATTTIKPASAVQQPLQTPVSTCVAAIENSGTEEEPTSVSKYFFSDIFTEVDELEDME